MKMIEVVTQFRYEKGTRHLSYTPFWIDPNNPAGRMKKAPASSHEQTSAGPSHPSPGRGFPTPRGRGSPTPRGCGRGRGMGARLAHGIAAFFLMCRNISVDVHELARRQWETDDNLRRQSISMGIPFAPACLTCLSMHPVQKSMNGTNKLMVFHSCMLKMKMLKKKSSLMIGISLSRLPTRVIRVPLHLILPQDPSGSTPPPANPREENFAVNLASRFFDPSPSW